MGKKVNIGAPKDTGSISQPAMAGPVSPSGGAPELTDWDHKNNADKLMEAQEIMGDPAKMKGALMHIKKKKMAIRGVQDLKNFHQQKYGAGGNPDMEVEGE